MVGSVETVEAVASRLVSRLKTYGPLAVAFSGGVDSAVVANAAFLALADQCVAVTAVSPSLSAFERKTAQQTARQIGIRHEEVFTGEFEIAEYRANSGDRCFYCKDTLYSLTTSALARLGVGMIANGANLDDLGDHRPGMQAAANYGVKSPLVEEGINKQMVRQLAFYWNLQVADKPAAPCLASRIAYGVPVTAERVLRIERAEAFIRERAGVDEFRVRCEADDLARIEVPVNMILRLAADDIRKPLTTYMRSIGFRAITIDLEGFRSGNLNQTLTFVPLAISNPQ